MSVQKMLHNRSPVRQTVQRRVWPDNVPWLTQDDRWDAVRMECVCLLAVVLNREREFDRQSVFLAVLHEVKRIMGDLVEAQPISGKL
jgi:hypothetical protein